MTYHRPILTHKARRNLEKRAAEAKALLELLNRKLAAGHVIDSRRSLTEFAQASLWKPGPATTQLRDFSLPECTRDCNVPPWLHCECTEINRFADEDRIMEAHMRDIAS